MSGAELVEAVRARDHLRSVCILFLVDYPSGLRRAALAGLGDEAVLYKPFDLDELADRVRRILPPR
jgi:DNA-binding response OmpR family regulator